MVKIDEPQKISRIEIIDENGRAYVNRHIATAEFQLQDDGKTLKIFIANKPTETHGE